MAINYASIYSDKVDEAFSLASITERAINKDYSWDGVETVYVYGVDTAPLNDYTVAGANRYGVPGELGDTKKAMTLSKDRSFTYTIDRRNYDGTMMTKEAGKSLRRQIDEVVTPEIDIYRIAVMGTNAGITNTGSEVAITKDNAYIEFLTMNGRITDQKVPLAGRLLYAAPGYFNKLKQDGSFVKASDIAQDMLIKGQLGQVDGVAVVLAPSSYLPLKTDFIITHPIATTSPMKLVDYKIHENPPGISGWLVEGRVIYDAFVLTKKSNAIAIHYNAI